MTKRESYLMIDHRASPGVPADFYRSIGFDMPAVAEGKMGEFAVLVCVHCQKHVIKNPERTRERANCSKCGNQYICDVCEFESRQPGYVHRPFKKVIDDTLELGLRSQAETNLVLPALLK